MKRHSAVCLFSFLFLPAIASAQPPRLSEELWADVHPIYQAILAHPFLKGLSDGSLPKEAFQFYVIQDALYLRDFARALAVASAKSPRDCWSAMFAEHARASLEAERSLHESFFKEWGLSEEAVYSTSMSPTNLAYTSYLLRVGYADSFEELLGAALACYWIYWEVGRALKSKGSANVLYQRWIDAYSSEKYGATVRKVLEAVDQAASDLPESRRAAIRKRFLTASRYEWMFWDAAWRQETWPIPAR